MLLLSFDTYLADNLSSYPLDWGTLQDKKNYNDFKFEKLPDKLPKKFCFIMLHHTACATAKIAIRTFANPASEVSAHVVLDKDGKIYNIVPKNKRAWHAGTSKFSDIPHEMNSFAFGIEFINTGQEPFTETQYKAGAKLCLIVILEYEIPVANIITHAEGAPSNKNDPSGYFSYIKLLQYMLTETQLLIKAYDSNNGKLTATSSPNSPTFSITKQYLRFVEKQIEQLLEIYTKVCNNSEIVLLNPFNTANLEPKKLDSTEVLQLKARMEKLGFHFNNKGAEYDIELCNIVTAFNRKYCPEIFELEEVNEENKTVLRANNACWYKLSELRLNSCLDISLPPLRLESNLSKISILPPF